jgi:glycosyltransferase involved in cell wall biosynthesis
MKQNKINKILVVASDRSGVSFFRSTIPHMYLEEKYPDLFSIDIDYEPDLSNDNFLKQYDLIHYHRTLGSYETMEDTLRRLKSFNIPSIMDIDDHWAPGLHHPAYLVIKNNQLDKKILNNVKLADNITTTTPLFAAEISKVNKNVFVLPNAINQSEEQFIPSPEQSNRIRFGFIGGSSHLHDLKILNGLVNKLKSEGYMDKIQFVLCGYDLRGNMTVIDEKTGTQTQRPIKPTESVWYEYEKIFTDNYSTVSPEYKEFLLKFKNEEYPNVANEPYRRVWTKPITSYATGYNLFDVSLVPLEENNFNFVKSQLKCVEAGFHKKALVAQNYGPYTIDLKNIIKFGGGVDETGNAILIDTKKNHKDWFTTIKKLVNNPELIKIMGENLHKDITSRYSLDAVSESRKDLYLNLINK